MAEMMSAVENSKAADNKQEPNQVVLPMGPADQCESAQLVKQELEQPQWLKPKPTRHDCLEYLINCALVILPIMFVIPVIAFVLQRAGVIKILGDTKFEPLLSYYFVLCWATIFIFSFIYCSKSIYESNLFAAFDHSNRAANPDLGGDMNDLSGLDMAYDYSSEYTGDDNNDYPPTYGDATGYYI